MKALVYDGSSPRLEFDWPRPRLLLGEARLSLRLAGICNTDLEIARGYMGFRGVLGHEFVASVVECDDPSWIGRRVVGEINCPCGVCARCALSRGNHCASRTVLGILGRDGVFADEFTLPIANLHGVPAGVSDAQAVFAEPLAAALRILEQVKVSKGDRVAVLGDGKLGSLIVFVLAEAAAEVVLFGRHPGRIEWPRNVVERAVDDRLAAGESRFSLVVDASGSERGLERALTLVEPLGTIVLKTTCHPQHRLSLAPVVIDEIQVIGSRCGPFDSALFALDRGTIPVERLIASSWPLSEADRALENAGRRGMLKVLIAGET